MQLTPIAQTETAAKPTPGPPIKVAAGLTHMAPTDTAVGSISIAPIGTAGPMPKPPIESAGEPTPIEVVGGVTPIQPIETAAAPTHTPAKAPPEAIPHTPICGCHYECHVHCIFILYSLTVERWQTVRGVGSTPTIGMLYTYIMCMGDCYASILDFTLRRLEFRSKLCAKFNF